MCTIHAYNTIHVHVLRVCGSIMNIAYNIMDNVHVTVIITGYIITGYVIL